MRALPLLLLAAGLAACAADSAPLVATDVVITAPRPGTRMSAGYLALTNTTSQVITITDITSPDFESVEMHESILDDGVARMVALEQVSIQPGMTMVFEPGGRHLMLMRPVAATDSVTLQFFAGDAQLLSVNANVGA